MSAEMPRIRSAEAFREVFGVSRETADRLAVYEGLLRTWQRTINLVSPATLEDAWHRHFADSAQLLNFSPLDAKNWLDLGSGAGFPGLVLAILLAERAPEAHMTLVESDSRKAAFLREVARKTGVAVEIRVERSENTATQAKSQIRDAITARALA
ncbi:MAG TPA: 16S rRNA (guanine(527)-N(7))-methyltransferase RsmG, partial [Hyphomicrobium sp.]|nr:16S rRNA (guanine(527)-N(7))-methyltransferase RsmG [Hyphomicrobium sp.]